MSAIWFVLGLIAGFIVALWIVREVTFMDDISEADAIDTATEENYPEVDRRKNTRVK